METTIKWHKGRPEKNGYYIIYWLHEVTTMGFTKEGGWNTHEGSYEHAIDDEDVKAWAEIPLEEITEKMEEFL